MQRSAWEDIANWQTKQRNNDTKSKHHVLMTINSKKRKDLWDNYLQFARRLFWNVYSWHVLVGLISDGPWRNLLVHLKKWTDKDEWQTFSACDLLHSSHVWIQRILSCGKYSTTVQIRIVSGFWFCRRSRGFKIYIWWNIMCFGRSYICSNQLDVWGTNFSFAQ